MSQLNFEAYNQLIDAISQNSCSELSWYDLTYPIFSQASLSNMEDFWRLVAYTYSWMPTIPEIKAHKIENSERLVSDLQQLRNGNSELLAGLFKQLIPIINNSLVGVSKVLHFVCPSQVPIIDRNVLIGWNYFFFELYPQFSVTKLASYHTALNHNHIPMYMKYRRELLQWWANCEGKVSLRDLEKRLFELGRKVSKSEGNEKVKEVEAIL